ncbi:hypothetical protein DPMN_026989 [Dreissena polymorpha]|uniref:Uncharacterized protein n=1 Tax=Dreissena polymorpha TaxID=45954 RepID=A0A9D4LW73_DREPO|nr:hypothetical protein DPMN_026989 [Dreissena polymorpha]
MARQRPTRLVMGPCIVEIDRIVIREVQYQLEVNRCRNKEIIVKGNFGWAWLMWAGRPRIDCIVIREVQYQFEVNRCKNKEIMVKGNFGWAWPMWAGPMWAGRPRYQFEVNRCRNEEIIVKGNFGWAWPMWAWPMWAWPMWAGCPRVVMGPCIAEIDRIVIREVQYQFEVNRWWAWPMWPGSPRINRIRRLSINFQVSSAKSVGGAGGQDGRTDR